MTDTPNPRAITDKAIAANVALIRTSFLAEVIEYTINENGVPLVDVKPIVQGRDNLGVNFERAPITGIPYNPPSAGGFIVYAPLQVGDIVECGVYERSAEEYTANGSTNYAPANPRKHHEADAFVRTKVRARIDNIEDSQVNETDLVIGLIDGSARFVITPGGVVTVHSADVRLGDATASQAVALNPAVLAQLQAIASSLAPLITWYNAGVAAAISAGVPVPAQFLPATPPAPVYTATLNGATKVKAV